MYAFSSTCIQLLHTCSFWFLFLSHIVLPTNLVSSPHTHLLLHSIQAMLTSIIEFSHRLNSSPNLSLNLHDLVTFPNCIISWNHILLFHSIYYSWNFHFHLFSSRAYGRHQLSSLVIFPKCLLKCLGHFRYSIYIW